MRWRVGIDTGGTFTDFVLLDEETGRVLAAKCPSTPKDPAHAFVTGLVDALGRARIRPAAVGGIFHGTTVATNAILEGKTGRTGLITTAGFRDVIEIRRHVRGQGQIYNLAFRPPEPLVPRHLRLEVRERLDARGEVLIPLDPDEARARARELMDRGVQAIAVVFLHAYANGSHEAEARTLIERESPDCFVSISSEVSPELREYERASTTVINASLQPVVAGYIAALEDRLSHEGIRAPLHLMQSNGGVMPARRSAERPVHLVVSGPVGGVIGGAAVARTAGFASAITLDVGGTSCDICLVEDAPRLVSQKEVAGNPIRVPMFDVHVIGAGGGSLAWMDDGGALRVGPKSAGAEPGPACYLRGGAEPTVTDADLALGRINPAYFLGGAMPLDVAAARRAIAERVARPLRLSVEAAAAGVLRVINATMAENITVVSVKQGFDPRDFALVAFGGAGPTHAGALLDDLQLSAVLIPPEPGTLSALGLLSTDMRCDQVRTFLRRADLVTDAEFAGLMGRLEDTGQAELARDGIRASAMAFERAVDMRYVGQAYEITVPVDGARDVAEIVERFHALHERLYAHRLDGAAVELVALRAAAVGRLPGAAPRHVEPGDLTPPGDALKARRPVFFDEAPGWVECAIYERGRLLGGNRIAGPAIIEQMDTTTVVFPGQQATVLPTGTLAIESRAAAAR
jgi:N-methylhydantoinase A